MSSEHHGAASRILSVLIVTGLLASALAVAMLIPSTSSTSGAPRLSSFAVAGERTATTPAVTCGQTPVVLNSSSTYAVLANSTVTNTGPTHLAGDLGLSPGTSVTGFPPGTFTGTENVNNASAAGAQGNLTKAYNDAANRTNCPITIAGNLGGQTLTPGLYKSTSSLAVSSGDLTLSGQGDAGAVFIFQVASSLTTTVGRFVNLTNGTQPGNVFWAVGSTATLGTNSTFAGTIMAYASVTLASGATLDGRALARTGAVTLAANSVTVPASSSPTYPVTFNATGLPPTTNWTATLGGAQVTSNMSSIVFHVANGTYAYSAGTAAAYAANPASGNLTVNGTAKNQTIAFTAAGGAGTYNVTFTETGLGNGMSWSMWFNGVHKSTSSGTIGFSAMNGTYPFTTGRVASHSSNPASGTVRVNGAAAGVPIAFTARGPGAYGVTFTSSGLANGLSWSVQMNGVLNSSTTGTIGFWATNGTNPFTVTAYPGYTITPSTGVVTVTGLAVTQVIGFSAVPPPTYSLTFTESGLIAGTNWSVTVNGTTMHSLVTTVVFTEPNGTYTFTIGAVAGHTATPASGSLPVNGAPAAQAIAFAAIPPKVYVVTFTETNLSSGTNWSVTFDGVAKSSITSTISFTKINGTFSFTVGAVSGYTASPNSGTVTVSGHAGSQTIAFTATQASSSSTPLTGEWWFWAAIVLLLAAIVVAAVLLLRRPKAEPPAGPK
jgi:ice-binding like protein